MDYEEIEYVLPSLYVALMAYEHGMLGHLIELGYNEVSEDDYGMSYDLLFGAIDFFVDAIDEQQRTEKWYFSFKCMNEYYQLCREYGSRHSLKLKDNCYYRDAETAVHRCMYMTQAYDYNWVLNTGVGHEWASGITFWYGEEFYQITELAECVLSMKAWFATAVEHLKAVLTNESTTGMRKEFAA